MSTNLVTSLPPTGLVDGETGGGEESSVTTTSSTTPLQYAQACWDRIFPNSPVYSFFFSEISITEASHGHITARLPVSTNLLNSKGGLHGSVSATLVDWAGGIAIASMGLEKTGVSTDIHVSYVSSAKEGDILTIEGHVRRLGRNLAFTAVTIYKGEIGEDGTRTIVADGTHTKYVLRDQPKKQDKSS